MNLLLIGQSVEDHIHRYGEVAVQPGGIFYAAAVLGTIKNEGDTISLHTSIEKDNYRLFQDYYRNTEQVNSPVLDKIPKVHLRFEPGKERCEKYENITAKLPVNIDNPNRFDGIYINMITGFDIDINDLERLRKNYNGPIYIDIHTLTRGLDDDLGRHFRKIPGFGRWAAAVDFLQCNEHEIAMTGDAEDEAGLAENILRLGPKFVIVTKGERGATLWTSTGNELSGFSRIADSFDSVNNVGCGDVFGSVFFYFYVSNSDVYTAMQYAAAAAGKVTEYNSTSKIKLIKEDVFTGIS